MRSGVSGGGLIARVFLVQGTFRNDTGPDNVTGVSVCLLCVPQKPANSVLPGHFHNIGLAVDPPPMRPCFWQGLDSLS